MIDRIVVIHDFCDPKGGATLLAVAAAVGLRERGYPVTFLTGDMGDNPALAAHGVDIVALGEGPAREARASSVFAKALYNHAAERFVRRWISANDTPGTIYHLNNWGQILSPSIFRALNKVRDRLLLSAHDFFHVCPNGSFSFLKSGELCGLTPMSGACVKADCDRKNYGFKLWRVARQAVRNVLFDTASPVPVLAIHERMRPLFVRGGVPNEWVRTLPNPVNPFLPARINAEDNGELLFVGRMEATKGPDLAAAAARRAGVKIRFVGNGVMRDQLERDYPEMIFHGHVPRDRIADLLGNVRALVMPSRYAEPYGLVAVEALWSGLPVIIADTAFLAPDIVAAGAGVACRSQDPDALEAAIREVFEDREWARRMSIAAYEGTRMLGNTPDAWIDALLALFRARIEPSPLRIREPAIA